MSSKKSFLYMCYGYGIESEIEKVFLGKDLLAIRERYIS